MQTTFNIVQIVISVLLIFSVILQHRGTGLGGAFGGGSNVYRSKRGLEKTLYISTIVLAVLFVASTVVHIFL